MRWCCSGDRHRGVEDTLEQKVFKCWCSPDLGQHMFSCPSLSSVGFESKDLGLLSPIPEHGHLSGVPLFEVQVMT